MERTNETVSVNAVGRTSLHFEYDGTSLAALDGSFSAERLRTYLKLASGNHGDAMRMYAQNVALGSAFYGPLQTLRSLCETQSTTYWRIAMGTSGSKISLCLKGANWRAQNARPKVSESNLPLVAWWLSSVSVSGWHCSPGPMKHASGARTCTDSSRHNRSDMNYTGNSTDFAPYEIA